MALLSRSVMGGNLKYAFFRQKLHMWKNQRRGLLILVFKSILLLPSSTIQADILINNDDLNSSLHEKAEHLSHSGAAASPPTSATGSKAGN